MNALTYRALRSTLLFHVALAVLIFGSALTLEFWQGWLYWLVLLACSLIVTLYFLRYDPGLIERRLKAGAAAEHEPTQKLILRCTYVIVAAAFLVPGLDHHFHWSSVPVP